MLAGMPQNNSMEPTQQALTESDYKTIMMVTRQLDINSRRASLADSTRHREMLDFNTWSPQTYNQMN